MSVYPQARRGQKQPKRLDLGEFATLNYQIRAIVNEFRKVKWQNKPRFDTMYMRKLFCLLYLQSIQADKGEFSVRDIFSFFSNNYKASIGYFEKLVYEGWIDQIQKAKARTTHIGVLSLLSLEFIALLRRRLEIVADEIDPNIPAVPRKNSKAFKEGVKNGTIDPITRKFVNPVKNYPLIEDINQPSILQEPITQARATDQVKQSVEPKESMQSSSDDLFSDISDGRS